MGVLETLGIECYTWSPEKGFTRFQASDNLAAASGGKGGDVTSPTEGGSRGNEPFDSPPLPASRGNQAVREQVDRIWAAFVKHMEPTATIAGEEERKIIRAALKVASEDECCHAIEGCRLSNYHMGENPQGRKYNTISHILRGKRGKKTTREQIDMFLDIRGKAIASGRSVSSSADPAIVGQKKDEVRRGHRLKGSPEAQRNAKAAEKWLAEQGIVTQRKPDGYPIWPSGGNG